MREVTSGLKSLAMSSDVERVELRIADFTLWWQPDMDTGRKKWIALRDWLKTKIKGMRILEVGYAWGGRVFPGSKVMDLYDPRPEVDYRMDACDMNGIPGEFFDLVSCVSVFEHIPKFWLAAAEVQRVLEIGGIVLIGAPSVWPYHPGGIHPATKKDMTYGGDYWRFNHAALTSLFDRCEKIVTWYSPAAPAAGDNPRSGWGAFYIGEKVR